MVDSLHSTCLCPINPAEVLGVELPLVRGPGLAVVVREAVDGVPDIAAEVAEHGRHHQHHHRHAAVQPEHRVAGVHSTRVYKPDQKDTELISRLHAHSPWHCSEHEHSHSMIF